MLWIVQNQLGRRNINDFVRGELVLVGKAALAERAKAQQVRKPSSVLPNLAEQTPIDTRKELAKAAAISHGNLHKVEAITKKATPKVAQAARASEISINQAEQLSRLTPEKQEAILPMVREGRSEFFTLPCKME